MVKYKFLVLLTDRYIYIWHVFIKSTKGTLRVVNETKTWIPGNKEYIHYMMFLSQLES